MSFPPQAPDSHSGKSLSEAKVRDTFVQLLFSLTTAEIARELADIVHRWKPGADFEPLVAAIFHLFVASALVTTSWVGWKLSTAPGKVKDVTAIFSIPFIVLLTDVGLVALYFILVKGAEITEFTNNPKPTPSAANETLWLCWVLVGYCFWDFLTKVVTVDDSKEEQTPSFTDRFKIWWSKKNGWISPIFSLLFLLIWLLFGGAASLLSVICVDVILIALLFLFRATKQNTKLPIKNWVWWILYTVLASSTIASFLSCYSKASNHSCYHFQSPSPKIPIPAVPPVKLNIPSTVLPTPSQPPKTTPKSSNSKASVIKPNNKSKASKTHP
jgi:hypothetical protein